MPRSAAAHPLPELPQHPPAQKVAGRRMSATKPRPHIVEPKVPSAAEDADEAEPVDYPRPAPPGTGEPHQHNQNEEEQPKRDRKHSVLENERKLQEDLYRKSEQNRPTKDIPATRASTTGARIIQPQNKVVM